MHANAGPNDEAASTQGAQTQAKAKAAVAKMQQQPTAFDAMSSEELKQILCAHYNAADLSEPEREECISIVSEEQDVSVLVELCLSEKLEPANTCVAATLIKLNW